jgi:ribosomal protein S18 acetylase RimI-like enzyme
MQALAQRVWSPASRWHVGDLAWGRFEHLDRDHDWPTALWESDGQVVAWGWAHLPGDLDLLVDPARADLADEVLAWFATLATADAPTVTVLDGEPHLIEALRRYGYTYDPDAPFFVHLARRLDRLPAPGVPAGFTGRHVGGDDVAARVAVHQAAFGPSRVTEASYRAVMAAWPYRAELDRVVQAPDGRLAAYCLAWLDERHRVGELEPVGTDPALRRLGLAKAACLDAMHALRDAGAEQAIVYARGDAAYPGPIRLYQALGFEPYARTLTFTRPR